MMTLKINFIINLALKILSSENSKTPKKIYYLNHIFNMNLFIIRLLIPSQYSFTLIVHIEHFDLSV